MPDAASADHANTHGPIIIDMGKKKRSEIQQLRRGEGDLVAEVTDCLAELKASGAISAEAQPVVLVVQEKRRTKPLLWPLMWP